MKKEIKIRVWNKIEKVMFFIGSNPNLTNYQTTIYELMQFTGLKDKNDKEIYEGDIINTNTIIKFNEKTGNFSCWSEREKDWVSRDYINLSYNREVIGNIYENKELLK